MDIERLTARNKDGIAYLVNVKPDEQEIYIPHKNTLKCVLDCFERLAQYEEDIARQSATSEDVAEAISHIQGGYGDIWQWPKKRRDTIITALQAYQPWVPVSERLPKNCESYLVVVREEDQPNDLIHVDVASSYGKYIDDFWDTFNDWKEGQEVHITHWKPLPEPPKGE